MKTKFIDFFKEDSAVSSIRLNSTIMVVTICACMVYLVFFLQQNIWEAFAILYGIAMGAKVTQKYAETRANTQSTINDKE